jgi:hypothetical protein
MDLTPQQQAFLKHYLDPKSETWGNAYKSALKAGYSEEYSQNITGQMPEWLSENISDDKLLRKANKNLESALDGMLDDPEKGGKPIQMKATELTLKGLQKSKWSDRQEITGKDGKDFVPSITGMRIINDNT